MNIISLQEVVSTDEQLGNAAKIYNVDNSIVSKKRIDALLKADCSNYTCLGIDSTEEDRAEVKSISRHIYQIIQSIDSESGKLLLETLDI